MDVAPIATVEQLLAVLAGGYRRRDELDDGDAVDLLTHSLQAAHEAYLVRPADEEFQIAALVHDIGRLVIGEQDPSTNADGPHPSAGAAAVGRLLGTRVADLVALHVEAKRYLASTDNAYWQSLSPASRRSFMAQGGLFSSAQIRRFERRRFSLDAVVLRQADDRAHEPGRVVPSLLSWRPVLESLAAAVERERERDRRAFEMAVIVR